MIANPKCRCRGGMPHADSWRTVITAALFCILGAHTATHAQDELGSEFTYQGKLIQSGTPADGPFDFVFTLWESGGQQVGSTEQANGVLVTDGLFVVSLDFGGDIFNGEARWLEIQVRPAGGGQFTTLNPRQQVTAVPYALQTRGLFVDEQGRVGIGTVTPNDKVQIESGFFNRVLSARNTKNGLVHAIVGEVTSDSGVGVRGLASGDGNFNYGVQGQSQSILGTGVHGWATAVSGTNIGVHGQTNSPDGYAAYFTGAAGSANYFQNWVGVGTDEPEAPLDIFTDDAYCVLRIVNANSLVANGIDCEVDGAFAIAINGISIDTNGQVGVGARGESRSPFGVGVFGKASSTTGQTFGVKGHCNSPDGYAAYFTGAAGSANYFQNWVGIGETHPLATFHVEATTDNGSYFHTTGGNAAVYAYASESEGGAMGLFAETEARQGNAIWGNALSTTGLTRGVIGTNSSTQGTGVQGTAYDATGRNYGVIGRSNSPNGFDFYASGAGVNYGASSSRRWKSAITSIDQPLQKISYLKGVYFDWDQEHGGQHDIGMIAEDVGTVLPEIVQYEENGIDALGMDYSKLTPLLVEAVKELNNQYQQKIAEYQRQWIDIQKENEDLRERLSRLESLVHELKASSAEK